MVSFNDMQQIQGYSNSAKKMEEEAQLQRLIDKKVEQKNQEKKLQEALQTQKAADTKSSEVAKSKYENQFKALEQISKQLNVKVQDLTSELLNQVVSTLDESQKALVQEIIKQEQLAQLKQEHNSQQLKNKGVEQQFSKEMQLMESIAKALKIPLEQLTASDVQKFMQAIKKVATEKSGTQEKVDQLAKELGIPKEQVSTKDLQKLLSLFNKQRFAPKQQIKDAQSKQVDVRADSKLDKLEARQEEIQRILDKLRGKQDETLNKLNGKDQESQKVLEKQMGTLQGKMEQLEQSLQQLNGQIKKTLDKDKKAELEARKTELEGQVKELKGSLKGLQTQKIEKQANEEQIKGKQDTLTASKEELKQVETRMKELNNLEKSLTAKLEKAPDENKATQIKEKIDNLKQEKEALTKQAELLSRDNKEVKSEKQASVIQTSPQEEIDSLQTKLKNLDSLERQLTSEIESEPDENKATQIKEKIDNLKQEKESISNQIKNTETKNKETISKDSQLTKPEVLAEKGIIKEALIKDILSKLDKAETDLKFKEVFEREINEQSTKEVTAKLLDVKGTIKDIQILRESLGQLKKLNNQEKTLQLKQIVGEIKNDQLKGKIETLIRQSNSANFLLDEIITGNKTEITDGEAILLSGSNLEELNNEQLTKLFNVMGDKISQLKLSVRSMEVLKGALKTEAQEIKEKRENLVGTLKSVVEMKSKGSLNSDKLIALFNTDSLGQEAIDQLMSQFEGLQSTEAQVQFSLLLRDLSGKDINALKMLLSLLVADGRVDESFIEEELGVVFTKEDAFEGEPVSKESLAVLSKLTKITQETMFTNEGLQLMISKGRIDRENFERLFKKEVSEDAWDYGVISFNKNSIGLLKERAEINSLSNFWKLMERFSSGGEKDTQETAELFLTTSKFSNYQRELVSFFVDQYQEYFIDPDFHLFDLYTKYMDGNTFVQINDDSREELCLAVMLRMIKNMEGPNKHNQFSRLIKFSQQKEDSLEFIRSVEVMEFYFSQGGTIKQEFLDVSKELKLFDSTTEWRDELKAELDESTISKMVTGFSKPAKKLESVKLGRLADRLKKK